MGYTLWEFLQSEVADSARLLTGAEDFRQIPIESVSVQELPVDDFIRKHELVLSTAVGCLEDPEKFRELILAVKSAGAAALMVTFREPSYRMEPEVAAYADKLHLPLFSIPWELRFSEIQSAVNKAILNKKLRIYQTLQARLFDAYFESMPLSEAALQVRHALGMCAAITDPERRILAGKRPISQGEECEDTPPLLELAIRAGGMLSGYMQLGPMTDCTADIPPGSSLEELLDKYVCFPLSLWFHQKTIEDLAVQRFKNDFVWDLAHKSSESKIELIKQGARLHFDLNHPYTCMVLRAIPQGKEQGVDDYAKTASAGAKIEDLLIQAGKVRDRTVMVTSRNLDFILYVSNSAEAPEAAAGRFLERLHRQLVCAFPDYQFRWGISEISQKEPDFPRLYQNAALALQYCLHSGNAQYRFTYRDTKEAQIVSILSGSEKMRQMAHEILEPLLQHGSDSSVNLLETLSAYFRCNYNISHTARTLHIHRQTLLYRLDKIRERTGMALDDHQNLFLLEVSLRVLARY